jgi:hypothetical protein
MKNAAFNHNQPPFTEDEIQQAKDFDAVVKRTTPPGSKGRTMAIVTLGILLTVGLGIWGWKAMDEEPAEIAVINTENTIEEPTIAYQPFTNPLEGIDVPYTTFTLVASTGKTIDLETGTVINIPAHAFRRANGELVEGAVTLKFREFHDVVSIFAAGIPMTYDSAGTQYHFESAGMFEILAYEGDNLLQTNPAAIISVDLASQQQGDYFNLYYLENNDQWNFMQKDTAKGISVIKTNTKFVTESPYEVSLTVNDKEIKPTKSQAKSIYEQADKNYKKALQAAKIIEPQLADDKLFSFKIDYKSTDFPELVPYKNVLFEITEKNKDFDPAQAKKEWVDIELTKTDEPQIYKATFYRKEEKMILWVRPVFTKKDLKSAENTFEQLFEEYDQKNKQKLSALLEEKKEKYAEFKAEQNAINAQLAAQIKINEDAQKIYESQGAVRRVFMVENFGMWNSDCPQKLPKGVDMEPLFVNEKNHDDTLTFTTLFMAEMNKNALYSLSGNWGVFDGKNEGYYNEMEEYKPIKGFSTKEIAHNTKNRTLVWGITTNNQLAVLKPAKLPKSVVKGKIVKLEMEVITKIPSDINELKKVLEW